VLSPVLSGCPTPPCEEHYLGGIAAWQGPVIGRKQRQELRSGKAELAPATQAKSIMIVAAYKGSPSSEGPPFIRQVVSSRATMAAQAFAIAGVSISRAFDSASSQSVVHAEERLGFPSRNPLIHLGQRQRRQNRSCRRGQLAERLV
jgi:hypothetical protein